jgi:hypothetical protein
VRDVDLRSRTIDAFGRRPRALAKHEALGQRLGVLRSRILLAVGNTVVDELAKPVAPSSSRRC